MHILVFDFNYLKVFALKLRLELEIQFKFAKI